MATSPNDFKTRDNPQLNAKERLNSLTASQLAWWAESSLAAKLKGQLLDRLPTDPQQAAAAILTVDDHEVAWGNLAMTFPLMSVVKPFLVLYLLETLGLDAVKQRVGIIPSQRPYNSVVELEIDQGWPRNPMINSGAICLANALPGETPSEQCHGLAQWLNDISGANLVLDAQVLAQVNAHPNWHNRALADLLQMAGHICQAPIALETYNRICCLRTTILDLAKLGRVLAGENPVVSRESRQIVNALMLTCGLYEASPQMMIEIGLPIKSGVSGAMLAVVPQAGAIALYSPPLDAAGNSVWALTVLSQLARGLGLSILA